MIYKLYKLLASNSGTVSQFTDGFKKGPKGIIKSIFLILLFLYLFAVMGIMYVLVMLNTYKILSASGTTELMPIISLLMATGIILFFGFASVASSYYTGNCEEMLLTLPITPGQLFTGKFAVAFVSDAIFGLLIFAISSGVYGYNEGLLTNPLFYIGFIVCALAFSVTAVFVIYFLFILVLYLIPPLRSKKILTVIATIFIIVFSAFYGMANSIVTSMMSDADFAMERLGGTVEKISEVGKNIPFIMYFSKALEGKILPILILAAITALILFVLVPLAGNMYVKTLNGFSDVKTKKISASKAEEVITKDVRSVSVFHAVFVRDFRSIIREPAFFSNGPLFVFIFPVIMLFSFAIGFISAGESVSEILYFLQEKLMELDADQILKLKYNITLGGAAYTVFSGTFANVATTSFSREGKSLYDLKAMPIQNEIIIKAKFWHAMLYVGFACVISIIVLIAADLFIGLPFSFSDYFEMCFMMVITSGSISTLLIFVDMFVDTINPKLQWENPMAATKQNMNVLLSMLITMVSCGLIVILELFVLPKQMYSFMILSVIFAVLAAPIGAGYFKYAQKRIPQL